MTPAWLFGRLRSTYWFVPSLVTGAAAAIGELLVLVDGAFPVGTSWLGWTYGGGADGARALLSAVAGSTITVVSVTFSVLVVALTVSSQHFGPRLLTNFMRDTPAQLVLGTFTGTYAYCLIVLRTVQGDGGDRYSLFVPHLAVSGAVILTLLSVAMLIYYVHHVAVSMQVSHITAAVVRDLERAIARLYPERIGNDPEPPAREPPTLPEDATMIAAASSGYVQEIDGHRMVDLASTHETTIWLLCGPGDFVIEGTAVAGAYPPPVNARALSDAYTNAYIIAAERTSHQDAAFAIQQLVEVALRALSPAVNETFTAVTCIDRLGQGLSKLLTRKTPSAVRTDSAGVPRVVARPQTFAELMGKAFEPIALSARGNPIICGRLLTTLNQLARSARRPEDRRAIGDVVDRVGRGGVMKSPSDEANAR